MPKTRRLPGGQGTALKPAYEPILLARKPLDGTIVTNLTRHGTGALQVDQAHVDGRFPAHVLHDHHPSCTPDDCHPDCPGRLIDT